MEFRRNISNLKHPNRTRGNGNIVNYGRFVSTNKVSSKISNLSNSRSNCFDKSKRSQNNDIEDNTVDRNSNCTERINLKSDFLLTKLAQQSKTIKNSLNVNKPCSLAESGKLVHTNRRRYKSIDNEELQKIVNTKTKESPSEIRTTVNKWLKETLPSLAIDAEYFKTIPGLNGGLKTNSNNQSTYTSICNDELQKEMTKKFMKIEKCCEDLLANSRSSNSKSYFRAVNFYQLLGNLYNSLKLIKTQRTNNVFEIKNSIQQELLNTSIHDYPSKTLDVEKDADISSLDEVSKLTNIHNYTYNVKKNTIKNSNISEIKEKSFEKKSDSKDSLYYSNLLMSQLLMASKVCIKSKNIVGIYDNFIEEQYVVSTFRVISNKEREVFLKDELKQKCKSTKETQLSSKAVINANYLSKIFTDKKSQTTNSILNERVPCSCGKMKQNDFPETSSKKKSDVKKVHIYGEGISKKIDYEKVMYQSENRESEDNLNNEIKEDGPKTNINEIIKNNYVPNDNNILCKINQTLLFKANVEVSNVPVYLVYDNSSEILSWQAYSSKVQNMYTFAITPENRSDILVANLHKTASWYKIPDKNNCRLPKSKERLRNPSKKESTHKEILIPPEKSKTSTLQIFENPNESHKMSLIEQSCQKIKESLEKNNYLPENFSDFYERLLKLQIILESIPRDKMCLTCEGLDEVDSTESGGSNFIRVDSSYDKYHTSLEEGIENIEKIDALKNQTPLKNKKSSGKVTPIGDSKSLKRGTTGSECNDDQSEVTKSLSILENLIDDFLKQNGLSNVKKH